MKSAASLSFLPLLWILVSCQVGAAAEPAASDTAALIERGRRIYEEGILPNGELLAATREGGMVTRGEGAACILCHQRSGMGLTEGAVPVPPITGTALFGKLELATYGRAPRRAPGMEFKDYHFKVRPPYTEATLALAIREGLSPGGHRFQYLMPRYDLAEPDMKALIVYLRVLSTQPSPGAGAGEIHFATVVAPDVEASRRDSYLGALQGCFDEKFSNAGAENPDGNKTGQRWRLHVWDLTGPPESWEKQLQARYERQPVFALVSGLGSDEWAPVERFCESGRIPCLFPNADVPGSPAGGRYSFYFFRGALLEADVMASYLAQQKDKFKRVMQVSRADGAGARAAAALQERLADTGLEISSHTFSSGAQESLVRALAGLGRQDALVVWLREADLAELSRRLATPPPAGMVLLSGLLGGLENAPVPESWQRRVLLTYPFDPPVRWNRRMDFNLRPWLAQRGLSGGDERMQGNTVTACNLLFEGMLRLRGQYLRDYLVEWTENYPTQMGNAPAPEAFPRFSLGPGQRFSSKGAYIVRFAAPPSRRLAPEQEWIVP